MKGSGFALDYVHLLHYVIKQIRIVVDHIQILLVG